MYLCQKLQSAGTQHNFILISISPYDKYTDNLYCQSSDSKDIFIRPPLGFSFYSLMKLNSKSVFDES